VDRLSRIEGIVIPFADNTEFVSNYIMPIVLLNSNKERRNKIREFIHAAGIQTSVHYPAVHKFSTFADLGAILPQTEYVTDNEITLPMYAALTPEQIDFICDTFEKAVRTL
jgi:dTDP-4-amino-4,6-dideoxygalactose transaminase